MKKPLAIAAVLFCLVPINTTLAQSGNASVGGFVRDPSQAFIPGVTITATNTQTGVVTTAISNDSGTYNLLSLLPGTYRLTAELPGFKNAGLQRRATRPGRDGPIQLHATGRCADGFG